MTSKLKLKLDGGPFHGSDNRFAGGDTLPIRIKVDNILYEGRYVLGTWQGKSYHVMPLKEVIQLGYRILVDCGECPRINTGCENKCSKSKS